MANNRQHKKNKTLAEQIAGAWGLDYYPYEIDVSYPTIELRIRSTDLAESTLIHLIRQLAQDKEVVCRIPSGTYSAKPAFFPLRLNQIMVGYKKDGLWNASEIVHKFYHQGHNDIGVIFHITCISSEGTNE